MKKIALLSAASLLLSAAAVADTSVYATRPNSLNNGGNFGLGLMLGEPTGLTAKYWLSRTDAVDFGFTYSFNNYSAILSDYLWHFQNVLREGNNASLIPFIGVGGILFMSSYGPGVLPNQHFFSGSGNSTAAFGLRIPLGVEFLPRTTPIGLFAELDPGIGLIPGTFGFMEAEVGGRFYF